ncbi:dUTP diphosphatase [Algihabitans albus]|uniref:dUTP diphosphatase n=1 Tax=Algihabitans albus TaxID=2164067 RepID=UPI000E5CF829|nr:dUTP diphosphatase [Algihabitans albus]
MNGETPSIPVEVVQLPHAQDLPLPRYETELSAGLDLLAAVEAPLVLTPGARALVPTGLSIALPAGTEAQIRPRSGLALKHGVTCLNTPGTIDADYRGEIKILLVNLGEADFAVERGTRIAQMVVAPVVQAVWRPVAALSETRRGTGGFGSTGTSAARS